MPLRLDIKKKLSARSDRVKSVDFHPTEPWALSALYSGNIFIWDYNTQTLVKQVEVCPNLPVRCAKFITRKQWIITASDDMHLRVFNYNTLEKQHEVEAHTDYIRFIAAHSTLPHVLSSSDDMLIKLWDWDKNWTCAQVFEGHAHYVMMCVWNPKDANIFATCSLDRSIKVWGTTGNNSAAHFSLSGHERGVNCVEYAPTGEKPYLISGSDDKTVKIWDYQTKQCIQTLTSHTNNVSAATFHPQLPIIMTGSEDGSVRIWHAATYRLESTLNYMLERVWSISTLKGSNSAAIGYDEGTVVIKLGSEEPIASMHSGKIIWAKGNEIQNANLKLVDEGSAAADGERIPLAARDMGAAEIFPQYLAHHPNGRLFAICGDGEYVIYTSTALRNKSFGQAVDFVWAYSGAYATKDANGKITIFQDFKESFSFKPPFTADELYGGRLVGVRGNDFVCFYDWTEYRLIRRIDVVPKDVIWSEDGNNVVIICADSFYVLRHDKEACQAAILGGHQIDEDGIEVAFDLTNEIGEKIVTGVWISDCFVYVTQTHRVQCLVAGSTETIAHLDRPMYILGYMPEQSKLYLIDKELNVVPYTLHLALIEYQSAIMRRDFETASNYFGQLPESLHNRVARFLENQGYAAEALSISKDDEHCFELATQLGKLEQAADYIVAISNQANPVMPPRGKWKTLGDVALEQGDFALARRCYDEAKDLSALFLLQTASGDRDGLLGTAKLAQDTGVNNIAVLCYLLIGDVSEALQVLVKSNRLPEASFFARTYCPSQLGGVVKLWKQDLSAVNQAVADALAGPEDNPELFTDFELTVAAEKVLKSKPQIPASRYLEEKQRFLGPEGQELHVLDLIKQFSPAGFEKMLLQGGSSPQPAPEVATQQPAAVTPQPVVEPPPVAAPAVVEPSPAVAAPPANSVGHGDGNFQEQFTVVQDGGVRIQPPEAPGPELTTPAAEPELATPAPETAAPPPDGGDELDLLM